MSISGLCVVSVCAVVPAPTSRHNDTHDGRSAICRGLSTAASPRHLPWESVSGDLTPSHSAEQDDLPGQGYWAHAGANAVPAPAPGHSAWGKSTTLPLEAPMFPWLE